MQIEALLESWGLPALVLGGALDADSAALLGGAVAGRGHFSFVGAALAVALGGALHDHVWFGLARLSRRNAAVRRILARPAARTWLDRLSRRPLAGSFVIRFIPGARTIGPVVLGSSGLGWPAYAAVEAVAVLAWGFVMTALGTGAGRAVEALFGRMPLPHHLGIILAGAVAVGFALWAVRRARRARTGPGD
ncbi:MAG: DedA family protein [Pseudomonadota bacterium]